MESFRLLDHAELADSKLTAEDVGSSRRAERMGEVWGVAAIVTGTSWMYSAPRVWTPKPGLRRARARNGITVPVCT